MVKIQTIPRNIAVDNETLEINENGAVQIKNLSNDIVENKSLINSGLITSTSWTNILNKNIDVTNYKKLLNLMYYFVGTSQFLTTEEQNLKVLINDVEILGNSMPSNTSSTEYPTGISGNKSFFENLEGQTTLNLKVQVRATGVNSSRRVRFLGEIYLKFL